MDFSSSVAYEAQGVGVSFELISFSLVSLFCGFTIVKAKQGF